MINLLSVAIAGILIIGAFLAAILLTVRAIHNRIAKHLTDTIG